MSISTRDKKILLMFSGVAVFAAGYFFGYRPQMSKAEEIETASAPLETRLNELLEMAKNKEFYVEETSKYNQEVSDYVAQFPAEVKEEDGILLARDMENTLDMEVSNIGISTRNFIASLDGSTEEEIGELVDQTLSEKANEQTQEQIDEIEGTDTKAEEALADATELGYAEADPTADVEGIYAARKVAIISQLIFHTNVTLDDVYKEGISKITSDDISYAKDFGYVIKLVGTSKMTDGKIEARVHPLLIDEKHPLASVRDSFNAVYVLGDALDAAMFMGRGAGDLPTASAVLGDVLDVMRNIMNNCTNRVPVDYYNNYEIMPIDNVESKFFLKTVVDDKPGVLALIAGDMAENGVSVKKVVQKNARDGVADLVFITDTVEENKFMASVKAIKELDSVKEISSIIRVK